MKSLIKTLNQITLVLIIGCTVGCTTTTNNSNLEMESIQKLAVLVYDISKSNDNYGILTTSHIEALYDNIAFNGGGIFIGYHIKQNSLEQEAVRIEIPSVKLLKEKGNMYQIEKIKRRNDQLIDEMTPLKTLFVNTVKENLLVSKTSKFTDVKNALVLAKMSLNQNEFNNYDKRLIIISDLVNDLPPIHGENKMDTVDFEQTDVYLVRPTRVENVKAMNLFITSSIEESIANFKT